jgi:hypothetical protein
MLSAQFAQVIPSTFHATFCICWFILKTNWLFFYFLLLQKYLQLLQIFCLGTNMIATAFQYDRFYFLNLQFAGKYGATIYYR